MTTRRKVHAPRWRGGRTSVCGLASLPDERLADYADWERVTCGNCRSIHDDGALPGYTERRPAWMGRALADGH